MNEETQRGRGGPLRLIDRLERKSGDADVFMTAFRELTDPKEIRDFFRNYVEDLLHLHHPHAELEAERRLTALLRDCKDGEVIGRWQKTLHLIKSAEELEREIATLRRIGVPRREPSVPPLAPAPAIKESPTSPPLPPPKQPRNQKKKLPEISDESQQAVIEKQPRIPPEQLKKRIRLLSELRRYRPGVNVMSTAFEILNTRDLVQQFFWELVENETKTTVADGEVFVRATIERMLNQIGESPRTTIWREALRDEVGLAHMRTIMANPKNFKEPRR